MYVAVRDSQLRHAAGPRDPFHAMELVGVRSVEVMVTSGLKTTGFPGHGGEPFDLNTDLDELAAACAGHEISICAFLMGNRFEEGAPEQTAWLVKTIRAAHALKVPAVRIDAVAREMETEPFLAKAAGIIREALRRTGDTGVALGVENHGRTSNRVEFLEALFEAVGSERMGLTLDTGNFYWYGHPLSRVYEIMEKLAPRVKHTHVKNIRYPEEVRERTREPGWEYGRYVSPVPDGDIDHGRVAAILKAAGYEGALALEDESYGRFDEATRTANLLRNVEHLGSVV